jgi:hypothetical protein
MAAAAGLIMAAAACDAGPPAPPPPPTPVDLDWQEITLPPPPAGERIVLRAATACDGRWYLTGAYGGPGDTTRPAAWMSTDGRTWTAMNVAADSYYGVRSVIFTAACRDGRLAAIGGRPGGAHGNPRMSSYHLVTAPDGTEVLTEVAARFELYGGPTATNVGRLSAGPKGFMIAGNRASGAAVWNSVDASKFEIVEGAPVLSTTPDRATWASDAAGGEDRWTLVGGVLRAGHIDRDPAVWTSPDGLVWQEVAVPAEPEYDEMTLVEPHGDALVAVGQSGPTFRAWRYAGGQWQPAGRFGSTQGLTQGGRAGAVLATSLSTTPDAVLAAVADGSAYQMFLSRDGGLTWHPLTAPMTTPAGSGTGLALTGVVDGGAQRVLLAADDSASARVFLADLPT